jgi:CSLREA domain-containing protein
MISEARLMRHRLIWSALIVGLIGLALPHLDGRADHAVFTVDSMRDAGDEVWGDGACATFLAECTLRAAIQEANVHPGHDTIVIPAGTYTLMIEGRDADEAGTGDLDITDDLTITGGSGAVNAVVDGGGIDRVFDIHEVIVQISNLTITHGRPMETFPPGPSGGGILNRSGNLTLTNVLLTENGAWFGGGIDNHGNLTMERSAVVNNGAGSISSSNNSTLTLANVSISGNSAGAFPDTSGTGGLVVNGAATLTNVTITDNGASWSGVGGLYNRSDALMVKNTIISGNAGQNCGGQKPITSLGHNLEDTDTCGFDAEGDLINVDPRLGPLGNIGGLTPGHYLEIDSPAIDAGSPDCPPPPTDQRGMARPQGPRCDIGAYEYKIIVLLIEQQLGDCLDEINIVWGHNNETKQWLAFQPGAPPELQALRAFHARGGYFIHANDHCTIAAPFPNEHPIYPGWNLIGWR